MRTRTDTTEDSEPKNENRELQPVFISGYIETEIMAQAKPRKKNSHIAVYAGDDQDFVNNGITVSRFPKTAMILLCTRLQKSASFVLPFPGGSTFIDMENALYPGTMAMARKKKLRDIKTTFVC